MSTVICTHCFLVMHIPCCEDRKVVSSICQNCLLKSAITGEERCFQCGQHTSGTLMNIRNSIILKNQQQSIRNINYNYNQIYQPRFDRNCQPQIQSTNFRSNSQVYLQNNFEETPIRTKEIHLCHNIKGSLNQASSQRHLFSQMQELSEQDVRMSNQVLSMPLNCEHRLIKQRRKIGKAQFSALKSQSPPPQLENWQEQQEAQSYASSVYYSDSNY